MIGFTYRPLARSAVYLRGAARRLAGKLRGKAGVKTEIHDGYLLRAVGSARSVTVTALDPAAVWLFLHHQTPPGGSLQRLLGVRALDRAALLGGVPADAVAPSTDNALVRWAPGAGYVGSIDSGALGLLVNTPALPAVRPDHIGVLTLGNTGDYTIGAATFATRFQLYGQAVRPMRARITPPGQDMTGAAIRSVDVQDWLLRESALQGLLGDANARMQVRMASSYPWYSVPTFAAQVARDAYDAAGAYRDIVVGGAYASQSQAAPRIGYAGVFVTRLRRPDPPPTAQYPLGSLWAWALRADANPDPEFVPSIVTPAGENPRVHAHGVTGVGMAYAGAAGDDTTLLVAGVHCAQGSVASPTVWVGLQAHRLTRAGAVATSTLRKTSAAVVWHIGPEVELFGVNGVLVAECDVSGGVVNQSTITTLHVGVDGVLRDTGLDAEGWFPFTQTLHNPAGKTGGAAWGQASRVAAAIGNGRVALLARNYTVLPGDAALVWTLIVLDAATGALVEARGALPATANTPTYSAHIAALEPERLRPDGSIAPAILLVTLGTDHCISRDGGMTWTPLFSDFRGLPVYLGNRLHKVEVGQGL